MQSTAKRNSDRIGLRAAVALAFGAAVTLAGCQTLPPGVQRPATIRVPYLEVVDDAVFGTAMHGGTPRDAETGAIRVVFGLGDASRTIQAKAKTVSDVSYVKLVIKKDDDKKFEGTAKWSEGKKESDSTKTFTIKDVETGKGYTVTAEALDKDQKSITKDKGKQENVEVTEKNTTEVALNIKLENGSNDYGKVKAKVTITDGEKSKGKDASFE